MNLTSFLVNKCFEYLLDSDPENGRRYHFEAQRESSQSNSTAISPILPPWSRKAQLFKSACDGCGACLSSCDNNILVPDNDGYPRIDFSVGSCSFCGACAENCPQDAFSFDPLSPPWDLTAFITNMCLTRNNVLCRTCAEHCEEDAIVMPQTNGSISPPRILADKCNGCGACFGPCPARAITFVDPAESMK